MPTPFYHLSLAEDLLLHPQMPADLRHLLETNRSAFLLGSTAPDVQSISGQDRQMTHFFDLPILPGMQTAWERFVDVYPDLARSGRLSEEQAAFVAGYLCHLQADWEWVATIFVPVFGPWSRWSTFRNRLYLHNVLRAYLDLQILDGLSSGMSATLQGAVPSGWLPFVQDQHLEQWRDWLADQLLPGAAVQTVEVFAARQGISPQEYYHLLESEERLDREIFIRLPRPRLKSYREHLLDANIRLLKSYYDGLGQ